jgi:thymidylate synthase
MQYIEQEFIDRISGVAMNPGNAWKLRSGLWNEFMHDGKFAYTYSERMAYQVARIIRELRERPDTRQAIITIHSYLGATGPVLNEHGAVVFEPSEDMESMGGASRVPCSMYYQLMIRERKLDLVYTMRSCDFLNHFPVDIMLALRLQSWAALTLGYEVGTFTYFTGSLHAYAKDMETRGIF